MFSYQRLKPAAQFLHGLSLASVLWLVNDNQIGGWPMAFALVGLIGAWAALFIIWSYSIGRNATADIWQYQRELMRISDQLLPSSPLFHNGVLLYMALVLEEASETAMVLVRTLHKAGGGPHYGSISRNLQTAAYHMQTVSVSVRGLIAEQEAQSQFPLRADFTRKQAKDLLDGVTDLAVVTAGLALSAGLPGAAGYIEVVESNLSKANPSTGMIDKDPTGKWIKGRNYRSPDLDAVLNQM